HQNKDLRLFEIGKAFVNRDGELPVERELFAVLLTGRDVFAERGLPGDAFDFYDLKGAVEMALDAVNASDVAFEAAEFTHLRNGQAAEIRLGSEIIGDLGRLDQEIE